MARPIPCRSCRIVRPHLPLGPCADAVERDYRDFLARRFLPRGSMVALIAAPSLFGGGTSNECAAAARPRTWSPPMPCPARSASPPRSHGSARRTVRTAQGQRGRGWAPASARKHRPASCARARPTRTGPPSESNPGPRNPQRGAMPPRAAAAGPSPRARSAPTDVGPSTATRAP